MTENDGGAARELMTALLDWVATLEGTTVTANSQGNSAQRGQLFWGQKYNCKVRGQHQCRARGYPVPTTAVDDDGGDKALYPPGNGMAEIENLGRRQ